MVPAGFPDASATNISTIHPNYPRPDSERPLDVRRDAQLVVAAVEDDKLRFEHDVPVDLYALAGVGLEAAEACCKTRTLAQQSLEREKKRDEGRLTVTVLGHLREVHERSRDGRHVVPHGDMEVRGVR